MMMKPEEIVNKMFVNDAFSQWLGIKVLDVGKGTCRLTMIIRKEMLNGFNIAHGAITYALADSALAFASNTHGRQSVSVDTAINHIETLQEGDQIIAKAKEVSIKNKLGVYRIEIKKNNTLVALFRGTVYRTSSNWEK